MNNLRFYFISSTCLFCAAIICSVSYELAVLALVLHHLKTVAKNITDFFSLERLMESAAAHILARHNEIHFLLILNVFGNGKFILMHPLGLCC